MPPAVETIRVMKTSPGEPPPPGGWAMTPSGAYPTDVQEVFQPGEKIMLGLSISDRSIGGEITFSGFTFFNRGTGAEQAIDVSPGSFGPWETGSTFLVGYHDLWDVPFEDGEYELRVYAGDKVVASALFNVGIRPASWGPEMEVFPAPVHDVSVVRARYQ